MRYGYHMGIGFYGSYILIFILIVILALIFWLSKNQSCASPFTIKLINTLKEKYASGMLTADEFVERKSVIEDIEFTNSYTPVLLERYARCEITTKEFFNIKNEIESNRNDSLICEQLAKGDLSYDEFKSNTNGGKTNEKQ